MIKKERLGARRSDIVEKRIEFKQDFETLGMELLFFEKFGGQRCLEFF